MWTQYSYKNMDEVIPTKEERITKIVNALKKYLQNPFLWKDLLIDL